MKPTKEQVDNTVKEMVVALTNAADAKSHYNDIVDTFKELFEDFDTSWLKEAAAKLYKKENSPESYATEREKREMAYQIVDGIDGE